MKFLIAIVVAVTALVAAFSAAADSFQNSVQAAAPTHPALYSFADVYRLTVSGAALGGFPATAQSATLSFLDSPVRVAVTQAAPELQFSVVGMPEPERWLLILAGLALALWVARRRLSYFF